MGCCALRNPDIDTGRLLFTKRGDYSALGVRLVLVYNPERCLRSPIMDATAVADAVTAITLTVAAISALGLAGLIVMVGVKSWRRARLVV